MQSVSSMAKLHLGRAMFAIKINANSFYVVIGGCYFLDLLLNPNLSFAFAVLGRLEPLWTMSVLYHDSVRWTLRQKGCCWALAISHLLIYI